MQGTAKSHQPMSLQPSNPSRAGRCSHREMLAGLVGAAPRARFVGEPQALSRAGRGSYICLDGARGAAPTKNGAYF